MYRKIKENIFQTDANAVYAIMMLFYACLNLFQFVRKEWKYNYRMYYIIISNLITVFGSINKNV